MGVTVEDNFAVNQRTTSRHIRHNGGLPGCGAPWTSLRGSGESMMGRCYGENRDTVTAEE